MWNKPDNEALSKLPAFYSTENVPLREKVIYHHYFLGGSDWYAAEYDQESRTFFGFAILNGDLEMSEWGYFSLDELSEIKVKWLEVDRNIHFQPTRAIDIDLIRKAQGWAQKGETYESKT